MVKQWKCSAYLLVAEAARHNEEHKSEPLYSLYPDGIELTRIALIGLLPLCPWRAWMSWW